MIIAHLPAGYLATSAWLSRRPGAACERRVFWAGAIGSLWPDLDLLWHTFVDGSQHHHRLLPHLPAVWLATSAALWAATAKASPTPRALARVFTATWGLHLVLDTFVGHILWAWPLSDRMFALFEVPATEAHWLLSFLFHWSFLIELALCAAAAWVWWRRRGGRRGR